MTFENTTVSNNTAGINGGGLIIYSSNTTINTAILTNSTFSANSSTGNGGGLEIEENSVVAINNSTIASNTASGLGVV